MTRTDTDVRVRGMEKKEPFDYTKWREANLDDDMSVRELSKKAMQYARTQ